MIEWVAAVQTSSPESQSSNSSAIEYFVVVLLAVVVGLIVRVFIRANAHRSSKR
jgi:hypothetical protein